MPGKFLAGAGRAVITPPLQTMLYGYAPGRPAESVADDLTVTAVALQQNNAAALLLSATVCSIHTDITDRIRRACSIETGVPADHIVVCATHTHSGPNTALTSGWGTLDTGYVDGTLIPGAVRAASEAWSSRRSAQFGIGTAQSDVGVNRREIQSDGSITLGQNPFAPFDPVMTVLSFRGDDGTVIANIIHYGAHCTAAGCNPEITRDWAGPMIDRLEEISGGITGFYNGAEGDTGPRLPTGWTTGDLKLAYELGGRAAADAVRAFRSIREWRGADVFIHTDTIRVPYLPLPSPETARAEIERIGDPDSMPADHRKHTAVNELLRWRGILAEYGSGEPPKTHFVFKQTVIAVGPVAFVPFPFEMFSEIALRIRKDSPYAHTLCLSSANGLFSYLPTEDQLCRGGYEIWAFRFGNVYTLTDSADTHMVRENLRLLRQMHPGSTGV